MLAVSPDGFGKAPVGGDQDEVTFDGERQV